MKQPFQYNGIKLTIQYKTHKLMGIAIYIDGERVTNWYDNYTDATKDLKEQLNNLQ